MGLLFAYISRFWLAATCHPCWLWLPHPWPCMESLTPIGLLPRRPQRHPYTINLTDSWLSGQRSLCILLPGPQEVHSYHLGSGASMSGSGRQSSSCLQNLGHIGSPKHGRGWDTQWVYDSYHIPLPAMSRKVLKLRVGSSWLQIQVMVGSWISGLSVDHTLLFHVQLSAWTEAGQCEHSQENHRTCLQRPHRSGRHCPYTCSMLSRNWPTSKHTAAISGNTPIPSPPAFSHLHCCAHDGPTPAVTTVPRDYHKHLPLRSWRWLWNDLPPEKKKFCFQSLKLRTSKTMQIPILRGTVWLMKVKYGLRSPCLYRWAMIMGGLQSKMDSSSPLRASLRHPAPIWVPWDHLTFRRPCYFSVAFHFFVLINTENNRGKI